MIKKILPGSLLCSAILSSTALGAEPTLIAPMLGGFGICEQALENPQIKSGAQAKQFCRDIGQSSAAMLEDFLAPLGPPLSRDGQFELGYMMGMPLLSYIAINDGSLAVDREAIRSDLNMLRQSQRKAVVYLFANHFVSYDYATQAKLIAESSEQELMHLSNGELPMDNYFSSSIYPWRLADDSTVFSQARDLAMSAVLEEMCALPSDARERIAALTTLGEVHHFFPNFKQGMGYDGPYLITDYSPASVAAFQSWLEQRFASIDDFNEVVGSDFSGFSQVQPPRKDRNLDPSIAPYEHLDRFAHGILPFYGWAFSNSDTPFSVSVYLDGVYHGQANVGMTRVDVAQALQELDDSNVGYRYDLDFSELAVGQHELELRFVQAQQESLLKRYTFNVENAKEAIFQWPKWVQKLWQKVALSENKDIRFWPDFPSDQVTVQFNPLARLWLEFREYQVTHEIERYADQVASHCFDREQIFSHQIAPDFNPSWDPTLFAASDSLAPNEHYQLGVNLYGGVTYGDFFFDWLQQHGHQRYALPEMHPMSSLPSGVIAQALQRHHDHGAAFISPYFMSIVPEQYGRDPEHDKFKLLPNNTHYGSDKLYQAIQQVMN